MIGSARGGSMILSCWPSWIWTPNFCCGCTAMTCVVIICLGASMAHSLVGFCTGEDMRVTRNILVAWGGPATHAVPAPWARSFVEAVASRRGRNVAEPPLPGPIRAREWLEENRTEEDAWRLVTRPAYVVLSAVYGADAELDVGTLKALVDSQALAPQQTFLGLTVEPVQE